MWQQPFLSFIVGDATTEAVLGGFVRPSAMFQPFHVNLFNVFNNEIGPGYTYNIIHPSRDSCFLI